MSRFDFIGDIHGHHQPLVRLLEKLDYREEDGVYRHPDRHAVFLGDLIDRGPGQREVVNLVRNMVEAGEAHCIMGNHEFNAIAFHLPDPQEPGEYLRKRTAANCKQAKAFTDAYRDSQAELDDVLDWLLGLPVLFEAPGVRAIHAAWSQTHIDRLHAWTGGRMRLDRDLVERASRKGEAEYDAIETVLKGPEVDMPPGTGFFMEEKHRDRARIAWWKRPGALFRDMVAGPQAAIDAVGDAPAVPHDFRYPADQKPVFFGHYWMAGTPALLGPNIACLDWSIAGKGGKLCAYRFDREQELDSRKLVWVEAGEA